MKTPIVSRKHIVQKTEFTIDTATVTTHVIAHGVAVQDVNTNFEVIEGNVVKAVFAEIWLLGVSSTQSTFVCILEKSPAGTSNPTFTQMTTLDAYRNKKNILFTSQGVLGASDTNPTPVLRQWIKIPKGKQRIGFEDEIRLSIASIGANNLVGCGMYIYKSYS